jgi:sugar lactone lactonase YvrE
MNVRILDGTQCELGEGPTYDPFQNKAWWFDIVGKRVFQLDFSNRESRVDELPFMASMLGVVDVRSQLVAAEAGLFIRDVASNRFTLHQAIEADDALTRSNDGRVHASGALWIGTMGKQAERQAGAIYWFFKGELRTLFSAVSIPNAICFSPDDRIAYFTDSPTGKLMTVAIDPVNALPRGEPAVLYDYGTQSGAMDGAVVDAEGAIWNACWGASRLNVISPEGQLLRSLPLPVRQPTCPAFVGQHLDKLLVTSAWQGMDEASRTADEHAGKTLVLDFPVRGRPEPRVVL